ncbi:MAG: NAD(P)-binding domain-containing protein [Eubacteriales bacterium]
MNEIGVIGTGVMGAALTKNFQSRGFQVADKYPIF